MPQVPIQEFPDTKGSEPQCDARVVEPQHQSGSLGYRVQSVVTALRAPNLSHLSLDITSQKCIKLLLKCADFVRPATTLAPCVDALYELDICRSRSCYCTAVNLRKPTWPCLHTLRLRNPSFPNLRNLFGVGPRIIPELRLLETLYTQQTLLTVEEEDWVRWNVWVLNLALEEGINCTRELSFSSGTRGARRAILNFKTYSRLHNGNAMPLALNDDLLELPLTQTTTFAV
ncbi:hypothetical protein K438DRAFT_1778234 [Mycena galopus ATCC 62051]|nr:hypothetical protein K438DRAFT_1778234 [Mycena galopus ATCC 62051]